MNLRIDKAKRIAYIQLSGRQDKKMILDAFDATVADSEYEAGVGRLWDMREADLTSLEASTIADMARYSMKFPAGINDVKVAFVVKRQVEFGLSRMFETFSSEAKTSVAVFYSIEEAEEWMAGRSATGYRNGKTSP